MSDAEAAVERQLLASGDNLDVDILKVGHHGSKTSTSQALLAATTPDVAIIEVGGKNRYGHPTQTVLDRLAKVGAGILRTDRDGTITFVSDGTKFERR
jgi:beta-lactamase superfamily II metal-dependent hydrolase